MSSNYGRHRRQPGPRPGCGLAERAGTALSETGVTISPSVSLAAVRLYSVLRWLLRLWPCRMLMLSTVNRCNVSRYVQCIVMTGHECVAVAECRVVLLTTETCCEHQSCDHCICSAAARDVLCCVLRPNMCTIAELNVSRGLCLFDMCTSTGVVRHLCIAVLTSWHRLSFVSVALASSMTVTAVR